MRILIATDWYLKLVVEGQALALRAQGHDVRLLCRAHAEEFAGNERERAALLDRLRDAGIGVVELPGRRYGPEGLAATMRAWRTLRRWSPDVVSAHQNTDPRLLFAVGRAPLVYTVHDPEPHPGERAPRLLERLSAAAWSRRADRLVVHGEQLLRQLPAATATDAVRIVPHGIDVVSEPLVAPAVPTVLLFGRLEPYKGVSDLVAAMEDVRARRPDVRAVVAGRGPALADVPRDGGFEVIGRYIGEDELRSLLREASVVVLPYTQASQSGVGLLSIAHGVPIVVTRVGALPELVPDERYVAEPGDPASLADRIVGALDADVADRIRFLDHADRCFSWDRVARRYVDVYRELVAPSTSR